MHFRQMPKLVMYESKLTILKILKKKTQIPIYNNFNIENLKNILNIYI